MRLAHTLGIAAVAALLAAPALARDPDASGGMQRGSMCSNTCSNMCSMNMQNMMGMHTMPATVSAVDQKSGLVEVDSEGMKLKVHFPPAALADLKVGDTITLHMGFAKP